MPPKTGYLALAMFTVLLREHNYSVTDILVFMQ